MPDDLPKGYKRCPHCGSVIPPWLGPSEDSTAVPTCPYCQKRL